MKPSVTETGNVITLESGNAVIMLKSGQSCKGCGAAKIGLCRAGNSFMFLTAKNTAEAKQGDRVIIGIDKKTQSIGYLLACLIPLSSFTAGAVTGYWLGSLLLLPSLVILSAFSCLIVTTAFTML